MLGALVLAGCATATVSSDHDRTVDFSKLKTYSWASEQKPTGDPRFDDPDLRAVIKQSIETELQAKGLRKSAAGQPDVLLKYYITVEAKREPLGDYYPPTFNSRTGMVTVDTFAVQNVAAFQYDDGTFVLDMLDPRSGGILWRGSLNGMVDPGGTPEKRKVRAPGAVAKVLAKFPPVTKVKE
jgi:hypothetical protein